MSPERTQGLALLGRAWPSLAAGVCAAAAFLAEVLIGDDGLPRWSRVGLGVVGCVAAFLAVVLSLRQAWRESARRTGAEARLRVTLECVVLPLLHTVQQAVTAPTPEILGRLTQAVVGAACRVVDADRDTWCGHYRLEHGRFVLVASTGQDLRAPDTIGRDSAIGPRLLDTVVRDKADFTEDPARDWGSRCEFAAVMAYPVVREGATRGMLLLGFRTPLPATADVTVLAALAKILAIGGAR